MQPSAATINVDSKLSSNEDEVDLTRQTIKNRFYRLSDAAKIIGESPQYVLNLIQRYKIIRPQKTYEKEKPTNSTYQLTEHELNKAREFVRLKRAGFKIKDIVDIFVNQDKLPSALDTIIDALSNWQKNPCDASKSKFMESLIKHPLLDAQEQIVLNMVYIGNCTFADCIAETSLNSEHEVRKVLQSAYSKIGTSLFHLPDID